MEGRSILSGLIALLVVLPVLGLAGHPYGTAMWLGDSAGSETFDLLGGGVTGNGAVVRVVFPDFESVISSGGSLGPSNTTVIAALTLDLDYNYTTGSVTVFDNGYAIPGTDAILRLSYTITVENSGIVDNAEGVLALMKRGRTVPIGSVNVSVELGAEPDTIRFQVNWSEVFQLYNENAQNPVEEGPFRVHLLVYNPSEPGQTPVGNFIVLAELQDVAPCGLEEFTIPAETIMFTGSEADWPENTLVCTDTAESEHGFPGNVDLASYWMAGDSQYLYIGIRMAGPPEGDIIDRMTYVSLYLYSPDMANSVVITFSSLRDPFTGEPLFNYVIWGNGLPFSQGDLGPDDIVVNGGMIEFRIPSNDLPSAVVWPGKQVIVDKIVSHANLEDSIDGLLEPGRIVMKELLINPSDNTTHALGNFTVKKIQAPAGSNATVETQGMRIRMPEVGAPVNVMLGQVMTPPIKGDPPGTGFRPLAYYYFNMSNPDSVSWPIHVYIEKPMGLKTVAAYYDKYTGRYEILPESNIVYHEDNNTIEIVMTRELYDRGDPAIILYAPPTVGGALTGETAALTSTGSAMPLYAIVLAILPFVVVFRMAMGRLRSYAPNKS